MSQIITYTYLVEPDEEDRVRLDVFLADQEDPPLSRSQVKKRIDAGEVTINGQVATKAGAWLREGDEVVWTHHPPVEPNLEAQAIPLRFLYEDGHVAVVDKPAGMVVHPAPGHPSGTLVNALMHHLKGDLAGIGGELRPGIVHRIDKDTSGALVVTKTDAAHRHLGELFRHHDIERRYHALCFGPSLPASGTIESLHGRDSRHRLRFTGRVDRGRHAVTHYRVLERFDSGACLVECRLETGRTHQIRMHLSEANAPLLGDELYGGPATAKNRLIGRQALHARTLGFTSVDGAEVHCQAPYPDDFAHALDRLRAGADWR